MHGQQQFDWGIPRTDQQQQQQPPAMQQQVVYVTVPVQSTSVSNYQHRQSLVLGSILLAAGILGIAINAASIGFDSTNRSDTAQFSFIGQGIWCGVMSILSGTFGILAAKNKTRCKVIAFMVLCIVTSALLTVQFLFGLMGTILIDIALRGEFGPCRSSYYYGPYYDRDPEQSIDRRPMCTVDLAFSACLMVLAVVEAALSIWGSAIACKAVCGCCGSLEGTAMQVVYQPQGQQIVLVPMQTTCTMTVPNSDSPVPTVYSELQQSTTLNRYERLQ